MSDTTTTLNPGSGGDVMDESLVTQGDRVTQAKRPRVVLGDDDGDLLATDTSRVGQKVLLVSIGDSAFALLERIIQNQETALALLEHIAGQV